MDQLPKIRLKNPDINIYSIFDDQFKLYGDIINVNFSEKDLFDIDLMIELPMEGNSYIAKSDELHKSRILCSIGEDVYGGLPFQIGYVAGYNNECNGFEYHQCSETMVFLTDAIIFLGQRHDLIENQYDINKSKAFFVPKGRCVELFSTTLHYSPCRIAKDGFKAVVFLLLNTNSPINEKNGICTKTNKWVITHPSKNQKIKEGVFPGLIGEIISINELNLDENNTMNISI